MNLSREELAHKIDAINQQLKEGSVKGFNAYQLNKSLEHYTNLYENYAVTHDSLLSELRENICDDLNFEDSSVGINFTSNLSDWAVNGAPHCEGVTVICYSESSVLIKCEERHFEIFNNGDTERGIVWDIRPFSKENLSISAVN